MCCKLSLAQLELFPLQSLANSGHSGVLRIESNQPLKLPFFDDFSQSNIVSTILWEDIGGTTITNDYSRKAPNFNALVFDGRDRLGRIYNSSNIYAIGKTDSLISRPIDLSTYNLKDSLVLSFFCQNGGFGDRSDGHQNDSIWLSFLDRDNRWVVVWSRKDNKTVPKIIFNTFTNQYDTVYYYANDTVFTPYFIPILNENFLHENFRFKFNTVGRMSGDYDIWLLDYVYLASNRSIRDTSFEDRSFSYLNSNIFKDYSIVPSSQFFTSKGLDLNNQLKLGYSNLKKSDEDPIDMRIMFLESKRVLWSNDIFLVTYNNPRINDVEINNIPSSLSIDRKDSFTLQLKVFFTNSPDTGIFKQNDSLIQNITIHNELAYDDGTAEFSATMNRQNAQLAYQFYLPEPDTLTHVRFYFPNVQAKMNNATFDLRIWKKIAKRDNKGKLIPGMFNELLYSKNKVVFYKDSLLNTFVEYKLDTPLVLSDTFYVGYLQKSQFDFYIGFDINSPIKSNHCIFTNTGRGWEKFMNAKGNLMIRPVFKNISIKSGKLDMNKEKTNQANLRIVFPNNSLNCFSILGIENPDFVLLYDIVGNQLAKFYGQAEGSYYCLHKLKSGLYIVVIEKDGKKYSVKMVYQY